MDGSKYKKIQDAINDVPADNTQKTITILKDTAETLTITQNQNIVFNIQEYTISNDGNHAVITNDGTVLLISTGSITSNADTATINNHKNGILRITGGNISATGTRQAVYNDKGTVEISGNAYLLLEVQ